MFYLTINKHTSLQCKQLNICPTKYQDLELFVVAQVIPGVSKGAISKSEKQVSLGNLKRNSKQSVQSVDRDQVNLFLSQL